MAPGRREDWEGRGQAEGAERSWEEKKEGLAIRAEE